MNPLPDPGAGLEIARPVGSSPRRRRLRPARDAASMLTTAALIRSATSAS
jgi:hypothetical protein